MDFSMKDTYRNYVETVSGGKNTVIYDQHGNPNIMVIINRFTNDYLGFGTGTHPAFIVGDKEVDEIFIGKYKACIGNGGAGASIPGVEIAGNMTLNSSREAAAKAGDGFHLITNAEIAAVALLSWKNGYIFNFNKPKKRGFMDDGCSEECRGIAGYAHDLCSHDGSQFGVFDMGTVGGWEWCDGVKIVNNEIFVHGIDGKPCNHAGYEDAPDDMTHFISLKRYLDARSAGDEDGNNRAILTDKPVTSANNASCACPMNATRYEHIGTVPNEVRQLAIYPPDDRTDISYGGVWISTGYGERNDYPVSYRRCYRCGSDSMSRAGLFSIAPEISIAADDSEFLYFRGFRIAYIPGIKQGKGWA